MHVDPATGLSPAAARAPLLVFYGGTFDPVHCGHLAIARAARDVLGVPIRLMPAADPPHRAPPGADAQQRAAMLDLAVAGEPGLCVDRRELQRSGRSYSVDTLREIRAGHGDAVPVALLVGADSFAALPGWHEWRALFALTHFVVADRPGSRLDQGLVPELEDAVAGRWCETPRQLAESPGGRVLRLRQPLHGASATAIRRGVAAGAHWRDDVPDAVADYIARNGLYLNAQDRDGAATPAPL